MEAGLDVPRETIDRLSVYCGRLVAANRTQNLIAASTVTDMWERHIRDSAQLHPLAVGTVLDVGSGAGLPGVVLAILGASVTLVEPRRRRAAFLSGIVGELELRASVHATRVERLQLPPHDTICARAYAPLDRIFATTLHLAHPGTRWVLPKGRSGVSELEVAQRAWHGDFRTLPSITDSEAVIIIAEGVRPKAQR